MCFTTIKNVLIIMFFFSVYIENVLLNFGSKMWFFHKYITIVGNLAKIITICDHNKIYLRSKTKFQQTITNPLALVPACLSSL